jgi:hypothetical protein
VLISEDSFLLRTDTIICVYHNTTGLKNPAQTTLKIWPNPASNRLQLSGFSGNRTYSILDLNGRILDSGLIREHSGINLEDLGHGMYMLRLEGFETVIFTVVKK